MIIEENAYQSPDEHQTYGQMWLPDSNITGMILVIHGLGEHCGRYATHFSDFYTFNNYGVAAFDLPGHGKSSGKKGHINNPFSLLEIIDNQIKIINDRFPNLPLFIYGHSFGGEIAIWYTLVRKPDINGLILSAPLIGPKDPVPFAKLILAKTLEKIMPSFCLNNGLNTDFLSRDPRIVNEYRADPLVHNKVSAKTGMMIINRGKWIMNNIHDNTGRILMMAGENEAIVNPEAIKSLAVKAPKIQLKIWPDLYHELHNEPEKEEVMAFTLDWMKNTKTIL